MSESSSTSFPSSSNLSTTNQYTSHAGRTTVRRGARSQDWFNRNRDVIVKVLFVAAAVLALAAVAMAITGIATKSVTLGLCSLIPAALAVGLFYIAKTAPTPTIYRSSRFARQGHDDHTPPQSPRIRRAPPSQTQGQDSTPPQSPRAPQQQEPDDEPLDPAIGLQLRPLPDRDKEPVAIIGNPPKANKQTVQFGEERARVFHKDLGTQDVNAQISIVNPVRGASADDQPMEPVTSAPNPANTVV